MTGSSRITVFFHKASSLDYGVWLTFQYAEWTQFYQLVTGFDLASESEKAASASGSIERLSREEIALTVGPWTVRLPREHFRGCKRPCISRMAGFSRRTVNSHAAF